ncbi:hypothetical protein AMAG_04555 [Allomyces macrogynus ATCC 38327]|uniref:Uncharacterized protein n=1 Tax=Allomyces macrogynus (strain ATCC 38327) TaxID=578462 RepID=A0A0L0S5K1_ALLM3|nr:hypothetical protein AMAG_04555 [Allomyces macrogynus ATCC 38327]|eukprot:KNE57696.1 hypothetical protein AMAG_04555 [Allomyces macrogynus ATCC 38327]
MLAAASTRAPRRLLHATAATSSSGGFWAALTQVATTAATRKQRAESKPVSGDADPVSAVSELARSSSSSSSTPRSPRSFTRRGQSSSSSGENAPFRREPTKFVQRPPRQQSARGPSESDLSGPITFETYQPTPLSEMNFATGNPWARNAAKLPRDTHGMLTDEKARVIREYLGGEYSQVAVPKEVAAKLSPEQLNTAEMALRVLNANASYPVKEKLVVLGTVIEGMTAGKVKRADVQQQ